MSKLDTICTSIQRNAGGDVLAQIMQRIGTLPENRTPARQGRYAVALMQALDDTCTPDVVRQVMQPCGGICISNSVLAKAKAARQASVDVPALLEKLNDQHIGGGALHIHDGYIIGVYSRCYCSLAKNAPTLSASYCRCSAGWYERLFAEMYPDSQVEVQLLQSILGGADDCRFAIGISGVTAALPA